ncbi:MAG: GNAT family N-acetyltransferase [Thermoleophilia bacterium]|nr:GNAT family N-acetyltransferase [Thermoleophilia bacterium]
MASPRVRIEETRQASAAEWDEFWETSAEATYFHSREWAEVWSRYAPPLEPYALLFTLSDGARLLFPASSRPALRGLGRALIASPGGTYGGLLGDAAASPAHRALAVRAIERAALEITWRVNPFAPQPDASSKGWNEQPDNTLALDLEAGFDVIRRGFTKGHRSAAAKAEREGVTVERASSLADWQAYFAVYEETLARWGDEARTRYRWELFAALESLGSSHVSLWLARIRSEILAGALCLGSQTHVAYWHGAVRSKALEVRPVHLLVRSSIEEACSRGLNWYDFNPSGGLGGVEHFKRGFGASPRAAPLLHYERPILTTGRRLRALLTGGGA